MRSILSRTTTSLVVLLLLSPTTFARTTDTEVRELAAKIDEHIAQGWKTAGVEPASPSSDAEFARRVYLDIIGRIPTVAEARTFLADKRPDKRLRLVENLLERPRYTTHFTNIWRSILIPEANNNFLVKLQQNGFERWLEKRIRRNVGYDDLARDLITSRIEKVGIESLTDGLSGKESPVAFFAAKEYSPANLAAGTARVFLGISVECAQCHNHPFADWNQEQFWSFAAFYSGMQSQRVMDFLLPDVENPEKREIGLPGTKKIVQAKYLDGTTPVWKAKQSTRHKLADWLTSPQNPYFARNGANRIWAYLFGTGLVEPLEDTVGPSSQVSHPELLEFLANEFAKHDFDHKFLIRVLTATRAYQLSSKITNKDQEDPTLFARAPLRGLTAEQLFDSVSTATGYRDFGPASENFFAGILDGQRSARAEFLTKFHSTERPRESRTSIPQALSLMNGRVTASATSLEHSETLSAILESPFATPKSQVETLYLATLSRLPSQKELTRVESFLGAARSRAKTDADRKTTDREAMADLFWALLNSSEFGLNH